MIQPEVHQSEWSPYNIIYPSPENGGFYALHMEARCPDDHVMISSFSATSDYCPGFSLDSYFQGTYLPEELMRFQSWPEETRANSSSDTRDQTVDELEPGDLEDVYKWIKESESDENLSSAQSMEGDEWSPGLSMVSSDNSTVVTQHNSSTAEYQEDDDIDDQLSLLHLLRAYGEAIGNDHKELSEVIMRCINEKVNPLGKTLARLASHLFNPVENQGGYLREESVKNFEAAFKAFHQSFPYSRFAHFTANSAIIEAMPDDAEFVHIVDFDMGDGIQWPSLMEALAQRKKSLILTSIRMADDCSRAQWDSEETRRRLYDHARSLGLKIQLEEVTMEVFLEDLSRFDRRNYGGWLVFNCMFRLPHMQRRQREGHVMQFLMMAKRTLANSALSRGIITFGDGEPGDSKDSCLDYSSFFNRHLMHYQALLESMEWNFPKTFAEARIAMEILFLAPYISRVAWLNDWEEGMERHGHQGETGLQGWRQSEDSLSLARELVNERESLFSVKLEGDQKHEMVLEWRDTPLIKVTTWL